MFILAWLVALLLGANGLIIPEMVMIIVTILAVLEALVYILAAIAGFLRK